MYSYNELMVLRLQVSVENLILELSTRYVRIGGVMTQVLRVLYVWQKFLSALSLQCSVCTVVLVLCRNLARHVNKSEQNNNYLNRNGPATPISSVRLLIS